MLKEIASVTQVYLVTGYTDLRLGIDGLAALVQGKLERLTVLCCSLSEK